MVKRLVETITTDGEVGEEWREVVERLVEYMTFDG